MTSRVPRSRRTGWKGLLDDHPLPDDGGLRVEFSDIDYAELEYEKGA
jgi:hypothetical protein